MQEIQHVYSRLQRQTAAAPLTKLIEASTLLQIPKQARNVDVIVDELTLNLSANQVINILRHIKPSAEFLEEPVTREFLDQTANRLALRDTRLTGADILGASKELESTHLLRFDVDQFVYSNVALDTVQLPKCLHLDDVAKCF